MNEAEFNRLLDDLYHELSMYEARFSRDHFEIGVLVSKTAAQLFVKFNGLQRYIQNGLHGLSAYLFAHKIVFVDADFIISHDGSQELIRPVIGCKETGYFPMEASEGDYVFFGGKLKQVKYEHFIDGQRALEVWDVDVDFTDNVYAQQRHDEHFCYTVHSLNRKRLHDDSWINSVDSSAINDYLSSLTIT